MSQYFKLSKKGFSLIEMLLVLGVLAVLLIASFIVYPKISVAKQADTEVKNAIMVMNRMETIFGGKSSGVGTGVANQARVFPSSMNGGNYAASAPIRSAWGGNVRISTMGVAMYDLIYENVSPEVCLELLPKLAINFQWVQIQQGSAGGGTQTWLKNPGHNLNNPSTSTLVNACTNNGSAFVLAIGYK